MSTKSDVCDRCGVEIFKGYCNCSAITQRDKEIDERGEAKAESIESQFCKIKDPQWKILRRRRPKRR